MEETEKKNPSFDLGFGFFVTTQTEEKKKNEKKENHNALAASINVSYTTTSRGLKRSQQNIQQNTQYIFSR